MRYIQTEQKEVQNVWFGNAALLAFVFLTEMLSYAQNFFLDPGFRQGKCIDKCLLGIIWDSPSHFPEFNSKLRMAFTNWKAHVRKNRQCNSIASTLVLFFFLILFPPHTLHFGLMHFLQWLHTTLIIYMQNLPLSFDAVLNSLLIWMQCSFDAARQVILSMKIRYRCLLEITIPCSAEVLRDPGEMGGWGSEERAAQLCCLLMV